MELYAIRYGVGFKYGSKGSVYKNAKDPSEKIEDFPFYFYVAKVEGKVIFFDVGFREGKTAYDMGIHIMSVQEEMEKILSKPYEADLIVITHSHFDHIDNLDLYQVPSIVISDLEYQIAMRERPEAVKNKLREAGVIRVENEYKIEDRFLFKVIGGHTPGSSVIYFREDGKDYCITGDECYTADNMRKNEEIGITFDADNNKRFLQEGYERGYIPLPYHDNTLSDCYKKITENIYQIL